MTASPPDDASCIYVSQKAACGTRTPLTDPAEETADGVGALPWAGAADYDSDLPI